METNLSFDAPRGDVRAGPLGEARGYWQPKPANGYAKVILAPNQIDSVLEKRTVYA